MIYSCVCRAPRSFTVVDYYSLLSKNQLQTPTPCLTSLRGEQSAGVSSWDGRNQPILELSRLLWIFNVSDRTVQVHSLLQLHVVVVDDRSALGSVNHHPLQTDPIYTETERERDDDCFSKTSLISQTVKGITRLERHYEKKRTQSINYIYTNRILTVMFNTIGSWLKVCLPCFLL